jgi:hypothetical protein
MTMLTKEWEYGIKPRYTERNGPDNYLRVMLPDLKMDVSRKAHIKPGYIYFTG